MTSQHPKLHRPLHTGLSLVPKPETKPSRSPLALWHLLSLDAPSVAALWTLFIARVAHVPLPWTAPAAMFVAVWMLYAADRLLDARPLLHGQNAPELEERHRFHHRHRNTFLALTLPAAATLAWMLHRGDVEALHLYTLLATLLAAWLILVHARPMKAHRLPKELAVGIFFPAAVFIPTVARAPQLRTSLLPAAAMFAAACMLNCLFVYLWEHPRERSQAHFTTQWATRWIVPLGIIVFLTTLAVSLLPGSFSHLILLRRPAIACTISVGLLLGLHIGHKRINPVSLRAAADLVLLSPLLLLFFH